MSFSFVLVDEEFVGHLRGIDAGDFLSRAGLDKLVVDEESSWQSDLPAVGSGEIDLEVCHCRRSPWVCGGKESERSCGNGKTTGLQRLGSTRSDQQREHVLKIKDLKKEFPAKQGINILIEETPRPEQYTVVVRGVDFLQVMDTKVSWLDGT